MVQERSSCDIDARPLIVSAGESMQDEVAPPVPARRGKKPTAPDHIKVYKTAVFKIHICRAFTSKGCPRLECPAAVAGC